MSVTWPCIRPSPDGCVLDLSVVPGAKRTEAIGLHDGALRLRLAAPPVDGKANDALLAWLAQQLGVPRRDLQLLRGTTSRRKQVLLRAVGEAQLAAWLSASLPTA